MATYAPFCEKQVDYMKRTQNSFLNLAEGGKRASKNVISILAWCTRLETHPDKLHLAGGVSNASAKLNIIDSNGFGVMNYFKGRCRAGKYQERDALYIQTAVGEKIILISGGGKEGDEKYIKGNSYGTAYITEANECAPSFIKEVFDRTLTSSDRALFMDFNPKSPKHWFYSEVVDFHIDNSAKITNYGLNYGHFTLLDNLSLSDDKIRQILQTYDQNSVWYRRDILGQRSSAEGLIYDMYSEKNKYHTGEGPNYNLWYRRYFSTDYGTINPFAMLEVIEQKDPATGIVYYYVDNMYYYDSKKGNRQKEDSEYAEDVQKFIADKRYVSNIVDPSAASFKVTCNNKGIRIKDADNEVLDGIRLVAQLLRTGRLKINTDNCKELELELASYIWDAKAAERGVEQPLKITDHCCDALRYFCKTIVKQLRLVA